MTTAEGTWPPIADPEVGTPRHYPTCTLECRDWDDHEAAGVGGGAPGCGAWLEGAERACKGCPGGSTSAEGSQCGPRSMQESFRDILRHTHLKNVVQGDLERPEVRNALTL